MIEEMSDDTQGTHRLTDLTIQNTGTKIAWRNDEKSTLIGLIASNEDAQRFYRNLPNSEIKDAGIWIDL